VLSVLLAVGLLAACRRESTVDLFLAARPRLRSTIYDAQLNADDCPSGPNSWLGQGPLHPPSEIDARTGLSTSGNHPLATAPIDATGSNLPDLWQQSRLRGTGGGSGLCCAVLPRRSNNIAMPAAALGVLVLGPLSIRTSEFQAWKCSANMVSVHGDHSGLAIASRPGRSTAPTLTAAPQRASAARIRTQLRIPCESSSDRFLVGGMDLVIARAKAESQSCPWPSPA